jgi:hypothetical protein
MDGYVRGVGEGEAHDWHRSRIVMKATGEETLGQLVRLDERSVP